MATDRVRAYLARIDRLRTTSGSSTEEILREAFKRLLSDWAEAEGLVFIAEQPLATGRGKGRKPDGTIRHDIRVVHGYWEAKDEADDLDEEIRRKRAVGYPTTNIIFEDGREARLWQHGREAMRAPCADPDGLAALVRAFFAYEPPVIEDWRVAVRQFQADLPAILAELRARIDAAYGDPDFRAASAAFLAHVRGTVNPALAEADVREMLIQHVLTEDIFTSVFSEGDFHRENNIARQLYDLERLFLGGAAKRELLRALQPYYVAIKRAAAEIGSHGEKQTFLKVIYEGFYKTYNPKAADRLGVIYTPNEIVRFMVRAADWLCREQFGRGLIDRGVEILDPCTGTGTFVCELLEFFRGQPELARKYREELHANEVAILPYYVANLNIEATYAAIAGQFAEYPNLVFADTLDMTEGLGIRRGDTPDLFGTISEENAERYNRQNRRRISVVIGNPPYNANQQNENHNNRNRAYRHVDDRVSRTFVKLSTAQKTKVYDMYARFYRWAFDRVADEGVVAFVTNRSFLDARTFDGFRRYVAEHFTECWVLDLKGNARTSGEQRRREGGNVFDDQIRVGVAIMFLVRNPARRGFRVLYDAVADYTSSAEKIAFLDKPLSERRMREIAPSAGGDWLDLPEHDWSDLIPVADKRTKGVKVAGQERAVFKFFTKGLVTARDEWVVSNTREHLAAAVKFHSDHYNSHLGKKGLPWEKSPRVKWTRSLKARLKAQRSLDPIESGIRSISYRPFVTRFVYYYPPLIEMEYQVHRLLGADGPVLSILLSGHPNKRPFQCLATRHIHSYHTLEDTEALPRHRYTPTGERVDNVTDWALNRFLRRYGRRAGVTKDAIFHYVYAALHDPLWRERYAVNLRREFPRIPLHDDFAFWADAGARLIALHTRYEDAAPWPLRRRDDPAVAEPRPLLRAHPAEGRVEIDTATELSGLPPRAWAYRLGNRAGLDWVLDQHREKAVRDPTAEAWLRDNPECRYRLADHKERVIDLLARVATVSVETLDIVETLRAASSVGR